MARKTAEEWEDYDSSRMTAAIREVAASPNLRFYFRSLLNSLGLNQTPTGGNALETARLCGRHEAGMEIVTTILAEEPTLYPILILEDLNEQVERSSVA